MIRVRPLKLDTKITIVVSVVLTIVFGVVAYFSDLAITNISQQEEQEESLLLATRISTTIEHLFKREEKTSSGLVRSHRETASVKWKEVEDALTETILSSHPEVLETRVYEKETGSNTWNEVVRLPAGITPASAEEALSMQEQLDTSKISDIRSEGPVRFIRALAPVDTGFGDSSFSGIGTVSVLLNFDQRQSYAGKLRGLMWPLMLLAIAAITLINYLLFRHLVYNPIDKLLAGMSQAEEGNLAVEVVPVAPDEIGVVTNQFNRMLKRIRQVTDQLETEQQQLEVRVYEATAEIADRKEQLQQANLRLFEMQRQLTQLERLAASGQLAAQFAHEVGTPLNLISGHVQLLRARSMDDKSAQRLDIIGKQIERITKIVRAMLDSTRRPGLRIASVDLNSLLSDILDATQPTLASRDVELKTDFCADLPDVEADSDQMQQVFINLINNSLDAMPDGGVLSVKTSHEGEKVAIELSDTGEGIPSEILSRIFDPLFSTKDGRGSGLGLTIVKQVIDEHNGTVSIENGADSGAVFRITLPCRLRIHNSGISGLYSTAGRNAPESPVAPESAGISESAPGSPTK